MNALSKLSDTSVSQKRVSGKLLLQDNDLIEIGQRRFIFHSLEKAPGSAKVFIYSMSLLSERSTDYIATFFDLLVACLVCEGKLQSILERYKVTPWFVAGRGRDRTGQDSAPGL